MEFHCKRIGENECYGIKELTLLFDISSRLTKSKDIESDLYSIMELMASYLHADKTMLTILNRNTHQLFIEVAYGLNEKQKAKGKYLIGEGIIGKVVQTGEPIIIHDVANDPSFLNKTGATIDTNSNQEVSFICIPIKEDEIVVGTLSMSREVEKKVSTQDDIRLLSIIGSMIAQSVRARQDRMEEMEELKRENLLLHNELNNKIRPKNVIGNSSKMEYVFGLISKVAPTNATVLIRGESGVGKELIADAIHFGSSRKNKPFIKVNCSALPESLIESELFGHEKGSFTGAITQKKGRFELANGGTIFLDEIGDIPASTQVKILRILQQREFERVGGSETLRIDIRIVAATNRNLEELIEKDKFREDLFYRLNVFPIFLPALRERKTDIPLLVDYFINKSNKMNATNIKRISSQAIDMLMSYHWPGNIRELENCIERAAILSAGDVIHGYHLPPTLQTAEASDTLSKDGLDQIIENVEKQIIEDTLKATKGNILKASEVLKITERIMGLRVKKYKINIKRYKSTTSNE